MCGLSLCLIIFYLWMYAAGGKLRSRVVKQRIVGGETTTLQEVGGFIVVIRFDGNFNCGGSYIAPLFIITAAHCLYRKLDRLQMYTVEGGVSSLTEINHRVRFAKVELPKDFDKKTLNMDIAVVKLTSPLKGVGIKFVDLCTHDLHTNDLVKVSGWGFTSMTGEQTMDKLRTVRMPIISKNLCLKTYKSKRNLTKAMICAGILGKMDSCIFDSGGPMIFQNQLCGVVSFGLGCAHKVYPGVYTNVKYATNFIKNAIKKLS